MGASAPDKEPGTMSKPTATDDTVAPKGLAIWTDLSENNPDPAMIGFFTPTLEDFSDLSFVDAAAMTTGSSPAAVRRLIRITEDILPKLLKALLNTPIGSRSRIDDLLAIADMTGNQQRDLLRKLNQMTTPPATLSELVQDTEILASSAIEPDPLASAWEEATDAERERFLEAVSPKGPKLRLRRTPGTSNTGTP